MRKLCLAALAAILFVCPAYAASITTTTCTDAAATDTGCFTLNLGRNDASVVAQVSGTFSGTLQFEGTADSLTWVNVPAFPVPKGQAVVSTTTTGLWALDVSRVSRVRVRASAFASGTAVVVLNASSAPLGGFGQFGALTSLISCRLTTTATTSTLVTGCEAPGAGLSIYLTDISVYGGVANAITASAAIQYGTGGTCGTGTTVVYDCQHVATAGCEHTFQTPKKLAANSELCIVDAAVGTKFVSASGFIAP